VQHNQNPVVGSKRKRRGEILLVQRLKKKDSDGFGRKDKADFIIRAGKQRGH
jgi:hypothetical protein